MKQKLGHLAERGVLIGTSSWKYSGWMGALYDEQRYVYRGRFAESRFKDNCLSEYAEVFKTVCVDAAYYAFPDHHYLDKLVSKVPPDFQFAFKATDTVTIKRYSKLPRFGTRAGQVNADFLNADLFASRFLRPCEEFRRNVGLIMFEFSKFHKPDYEHGRDFVADLDRFLGNLPAGWPYGVEVRNRHWLRPDYFDVLRQHGATHVFNSWTDMPPVGEQMALAGSRTNPNLVAARFLLKPGRTFEAAVSAFSPYAELKEPIPEARRAGAALIKEGMAQGTKRKTLIFINNRLEGNALATIFALLREAELEND